MCLQFPRRAYSELATDGSVLKNLPAKQGIQVQSLGQEDLLGKEMATHSSILVWEIPQTEKPGGLQSTKSHKSQSQLSD